MHTRKKRLRGMRDLMTIQGLAGRTLPNSREQIVAEQARLEHERSRLEREQAMWEGNLQRTIERLNIVIERLALLGNALEPEKEERPAAMRRNAPAHDEPALDQTEWHEVVLEY